METIHRERERERHRHSHRCTDTQTHTYTHTTEKTILNNRRTAGGIIHYRAIVTKIAYHCHKNRHDQWNRI